MRPARALAALALATTAAALAAGCGGGGDDPAADLPAATAPSAMAAPVAVAAVPPGGPVTAGPTTPKPVAKALAGSKVVVVAFLVDGPADDDSVAAAVRALRGDRGMTRAADIFVYTVGTDRFGDLADLLGVTGTPSVVVIGRDRTLINRWDGLSDAGILRQSISDAADTAAANRGAAAAVGPRGNARGIALATRAGAAYRGVPAITIEGSFPAEGIGTLTVAGTLRLTKNAVTAMSGTFSLAGARFEMVVTDAATSIRAEGAACWARLPGSTVGARATPEPVVTLAAGARVSAPRKEGAGQLVDVTAGGESVTYVIDRAGGRLREARTPQGTLTFTPLDAAPALPDTAPVCDDPADALEGLPASVGGGS